MPPGTPTARPAHETQPDAAKPRHSRFIGEFEDLVFLPHTPTEEERAAEVEIEAALQSREKPTRG